MSPLIPLFTGACAVIPGRTKCELGIQRLLREIPGPVLRTAPE
ncbi:hypothetical protein SAMN05444169_6125 [Bradyrhizobium erythrophlei]|uniref:Uncharacterized protein n=1 Tax=Bradyrhizobium erythrophlei TaxID=1437360 RepID=A0A1M5QTQ8_9BRAD|nr:hypothetical protein SAMN05444169_6125 [Bradyrhizobium erythrophlei]